MLELATIRYSNFFIFKQIGKDRSGFLLLTNRKILHKALQTDMSRYLNSCPPLSMSFVFWPKLLSPGFFVLHYIICLLIQGFSESTIINTFDRRCRRWQKIQKGAFVTLKLQGSSSFSNTEILKVPKSYLMAFHERIEDILLKVINIRYTVCTFIW